MKPSDCFHCGEAIKTTEKHTVMIANKEQWMCCLGCEAIAQTIVDNGLTSYYEFRTKNAEKFTIIPDLIRDFSFSLKGLGKGKYLAVGVLDYEDSEEIQAAKLEFEIN